MGMMSTTKGQAMAIGSRIRSARLAAGLAQQELADAIGVSKNMVSKYEKGDSCPPSSVLIQIAGKIGVRVEYFFRRTAVSVTDGAFRRHSRLSQSRQQAIEAQVLERLERYLDVEALLDCERPEQVAPAVGERAPLATEDDAEAAAAALREAWQLGLDPIENLCETLEDHGVKVVCHEVSDRQFSGWSCWVNSTVPVVVANSHRCYTNLYRQRFTLAHELAHAWFSLPDDAKLAERLANRFAGAFLVPSAAVDREYGHRRVRLLVSVLEQLKAKWGVSMAAWVHRLSDLGYLTDAEAARFWLYRNRAGWTVAEPGDDGTELERTTRFERLVGQAWADRLIGDARAAELLGGPVAWRSDPLATRTL